MYGLVNRAIEDLVVTQFGQDKWDKIKRRAEVNVEAFVGMNPYPDEVTYKLVGATSEVLGIPPDQVLESFGEYWILYTAEEGYGELLDMCGDSFVEFLQNMDSLHGRIQLTLPELKPPILKCTDVGEKSMRLHYHSGREGLAPMVVGLLKGLGKRFATLIEVTHDKVRGEGCDHDEFVIHFTRQHDS